MLDEEDFRESTRDVMDGFARKHLEELLAQRKANAANVGSVAGWMLWMLLDVGVGWLRG